MQTYPSRKKQCSRYTTEDFLCWLTTDLIKYFISRNLKISFQKENRFSQLVSRQDGGFKVEFQAMIGIQSMVSRQSKGLKTLKVCGESSQPGLSFQCGVSSQGGNFKTG